MADASSPIDGVSVLVNVDTSAKSRSYPHEIGQWTTHVYLDGKFGHVMSSPCLSMPLRLVKGEDLKEQVESILEEHHQHSLGIQLVDELHVSLFRGHLVLRFHQIQPFVDNLTSRVSKIPKFKLILNRVQILRNDEGTRSFICLRIDPRFKNLSLDRLIQEIDNCLHDFEREDQRERKYQDTFITHCSLIWFQGDTKKEEENSLKPLLDSLEQEFEEDPLKLQVDSISVKVGNQTFLLHLKS